MNVKKEYKGQDAILALRENRCPSCEGRLEKYEGKEAKNHSWCYLKQCFHCKKKFYGHYNDMGQGVDQVDEVDNFIETVEITKIEDLAVFYNYRGRDYMYRYEDKLPTEEEIKKHLKLMTEQHLSR